MTNGQEADLVPLTIRVSSSEKAKVLEILKVNRMSLQQAFGQQWDDFYKALVKGSFVVRQRRPRAQKLRVPQKAS